MKFIGSCVSIDDYDAIREMVDTADELTRRAAMARISYVELRKLEESLGYSRKFHMSNDWHVRYFVSTFRGKYCVFVRHSGIEYIFT